MNQTTNKMKWIIATIVTLLILAVILNVAYRFRARVLGWKPGTIEMAELELGEDNFEIKTFGSWILGSWGVFYRAA